MWRVWAASAVLAVPLAFGVAAARDEPEEIRAHSRLSAVEADVASPFAFPGYYNLGLLLGIRRLVPEAATIAFVPRRDPDVYVATGWARWAAFAIAPRLVVEDARDAAWLVYVGRRPPSGFAHVWRFGDDRLVRR